MEYTNNLDLVLTNEENLMNKLYKDETLFKNYTTALKNEYKLDKDIQDDMNSPYRLDLKEEYEREYDDENEIFDQNVPSLNQIRNTITILLKDLCMLNEKSLSYDDPDFSLNLDLQYFNTLILKIKKLENEYDMLEKNEKPMFQNNEDELESQLDTYVPHENLELLDCDQVLDSYLEYNTKNLTLREDNPSKTDKHAYEKIIKTKIDMLNGLNQNIHTNILSLTEKIQNLEKIKNTIVTRELDSLKTIYKENIIDKYNNKVGEYKEYLTGVIIEDFQQSAEDKLDFLSIPELFQFVLNLIHIKIETLKDLIAREKSIASTTSNNLQLWLEFIQEIEMFETELLNILTDDSLNDTDSEKTGENNLNNSVMNKNYKDEKIKTLFDQYISSIEVKIMNVCNLESLNISKYIDKELEYIKLTRKSL